jgi:hypothetical protein
MQTVKMEASNLLPRQRQIIPFLVACRSAEEARKRARVGQKTLYQWLKNPLFRQELERARNEVIDAGLERLKASITQAVDVLSETMVGEDPVLRLRAAGMVLDHFWKVREMKEMEERLRRVEEVLLTGREIH